MLQVERLHQRAILMGSLRSFFVCRGFLEVDTPIRQPLLIPERYIEPLRSEDAYLQTSPELCMKRLLAHGCSKIFQICACFRKNEQGQRHLEEFTMLEWYHSGESYLKLMDDCEGLLRFVKRQLSHCVEEQGVSDTSFAGFDFEGPWERLTVATAFLKYSPYSVTEAIESDRFDEILVEYVEPQLGQKTPTFLMDYPLELGSLARSKIDKPKLVERFELYLGGVELANGFSELTDEAEQRSRFEEEIIDIEKTWGSNIQMPERFLEDIGKIKSAAGIALGVDRLFMLGLGIEDIGDAVSFSPVDLT
ncbi:MAG: lysyl-tRNA synthetase class 2 [Desulforhopalus sp.]|jgi:lysyl-tRNA synthetase class 2